MKMKELEAVAHAELLQLVKRLHGFGHGEAELRTVSAGTFPAPGTAASELDANPNLGPHADLPGILHDQAQLGILLDHGYDLAAELLREHGHLDVLVVLK